MSTTYGTARNNAESFNRWGFLALLATQFQGAFSDNVYKLIIIFCAPLFLANPAYKDYVTPLSTALFNLPWLMFPAIAGALADRFSKKRVTVWTKLWELGVMTSGVIAVFLQSPALLFFTLFLMAMQSTFFSPAKYGILPEILPESRLSWGNGLLNMWTFLAIIMGTATAGFLLSFFGENVHYAMLAMVSFSVAGLGCSLFVTPAPPAAPNTTLTINPYAGMPEFFRTFWRDRRLFLAMVGISYFWFAGALIMQNIIELSKATQLTPQQTSFLLAIMALGIGLGSLAAGYLSRGKIELGLVSLGGIGLAVLCMLLALPGLDVAGNLVLLFLMGFSAGLFDVPLAALLQQRSPEKVKGGMIATSNFVTFASMMVAALLFMLLFSVLHLHPQTIFLVTGLISVAVLAYLGWLEPLVFLRAPLWALDGTLYRLRVIGRKHVPEKGGALLVSTHISFIDTLALIAANDRELHFVMGREIYEVPWMRFVARFMKIIPVSAGADPRELEIVVTRIRERIAAGHVVCVNNEKRFHRDGPDLPWHADYNLLTDGLNAPILPVYMSRLWESLYTFRGKKAVWKWPGQFRFPIWMQFGAPLEPGTPATEVRAAVLAQGALSFAKRPLRDKLLHRAFIRAARRNRRNFCVADATTGQLNYLKTLVGSIIFARKLKRILNDSNMVGVLVPPSVGGLLTNVALGMLGRVPVNLNYTVSPETMASCAQQCGITQVLTSKKFLERLPLQVPGQTILLEDIRATVTHKDQIIGMLFALFAPVRMLERSLGTPKRTEHDLATIIFSSGSEGAPKGVMLSHRNILTQTETVASTFPHDQHTCIVGFLPFFHSFGFTGTLWMPIVNGIRGIFHPSPLEPRAIGNLVQQYHGNILIATSTFLQGFIRRCTPEQLSSIEFIVTGAEKLPERVRVAFKEKFGVEPMEGFGATECAPAVSVNVPDSESPGFLCRSLRHGTIGRPLPGQSVRIVDPDTGVPLPVGQPGLMEVFGPNIMQGYLGQPEKTAKVIKDGWYSTGDIAVLDDESFIAITDRLARFSKIGGEMVSHTKVEETLHTLLDLSEAALAVASVPDVQKGERLVVLHTLSDDQLEELLRKLDSSELPNLWRPRSNAFYRIDAIPVLGTGKMDIKAVKSMAQALDIG
jgi:acyl-[acyl-carrier-protein]-phospholipid O-acyltransferase/long-chain-fatty-acid--[acyl-carrier-protein] ligase